MYLKHLFPSAVSQAGSVQRELGLEKGRPLSDGGKMLPPQRSQGRNHETLASDRPVLRNLVPEPEGLGED